jgi:hypothetical protein
MIEARLNVVDSIGDVVETAAAPGQEPGDLRLGPRAAEQLDARRAHFEHDRFDAVGSHHLAMRRDRPGQALVGGDGELEVCDGDSHVVDTGECVRHRRPSIGSNTATRRSLPRTRC